MEGNPYLEEEDEKSAENLQVCASDGDESDSKLVQSQVRSPVIRGSSGSMKHSSELIEHGTFKRLKMQEEFRSVSPGKQEKDEDFWAIEGIHSQEEEDLAEKLRKVCTPYGDERESKLNESSEILFSMGCLYLKKAEATTGMEQKLNFVRAAALLHGARVRFEIIMGAKDVRTLDRLERTMLNAYGHKLTGTRTFFEISQILKRVLKTLRKVQELDLKKLRKIPENLPEDDARKKQLEKITLVQYMMIRNTVNFKFLMSYTAQKCLEILGKPPCHFAIAGLGSLARQEITLYSDFEHVIILEEGMQDSPEYENIKEYFRWFATVFEVIIIGLGETIIRSVGVKSLNDLYATDKSKNWFYDMITPSGVSIDGMMPHACKTPLGRQEFTKKRQHVVELILPVSQMASLLTTDEDLRNGYNLKDVLCQTCFVFGCEALFWCFRQQAQNVLLFEDEKDGLDSVRKLTINNVNDMVKGEVVNFAIGHFEIDSKSSYYRPLSALLSYFGRVQKSDNLSSFKIISKWFESDHGMLWALAVACELRMKVYAYGNGNRLRVLNKGFLHFVGLPCVLNCIRQVYELCILLHNKPSSVRIEDPSLFNGVVRSMMTIGQYKEASKILRKEIEILENGLLAADNKEDILNNRRLMLARCYYNAAIESLHSEEKAEFLDKTKQLLKSCDDNPHEQADMIFSTLCIEGRSRDALEYVDKFLKRGDGDAVFTEYSINCFAFGESIPKSFTDFSSAVSYCDDALTKYRGVYSQLALKYGRALSMVESDIAGGRKELCDLTVDVVKNRIRDVVKSFVLMFLNKVFVMQLHKKWWEDALTSLEMSEMLLESKFQNDFVGKCVSHLLGDNASACYFINSKLCHDSSRKYELFAKGLRSCGNPKNLLVCEGQYVHFMNASALYLLLHSDCETTLLLKYSNELKSEDLDNFDARTSIISQLLLLLGFYQKKISHGDILDVAQGLLGLIDDFRSILRHPLFANALLSICHDVNFAVQLYHKMQENLPFKALGSDQDTVELVEYDEGIFPSEDQGFDGDFCPFERMERKNFDGSDSDQSIDVAVGQDESGGREFDSPKQKADDFDSESDGSVNGAGLNHDIFAEDDEGMSFNRFKRMESLKQKLDEFFHEMTLEVYLFDESFIGKEYDDTMSKWFHADFEASVRGFWKIVNHKIRDYAIWRRSVVMFCHSVVIVLGMKHLYHSDFIEPLPSAVKWPFLVQYPEESGV